jgi:hypothetical protein
LPAIHLQGLSGGPPNRRARTTRRSIGERLKRRNRQAALPPRKGEIGHNQVTLSYNAKAPNNRGFLSKQRIYNGR